jgi:hypothetical protein
VSVCVCVCERERERERGGGDAGTSMINVVMYLRGKVRERGIILAMGTDSNIRWREGVT